jgi:NodT family efflux transporter outer membrane factor (OMF) lipoprotein
VLLLLVSACTVGPDYVPPVVPTEAAWGELRTPVPTPAAPTPAPDLEWESSQPSEEPLAQQWWTVFGDPTLDSLVERAVDSNLDLKQAEARVREARALRTIAKSYLLPSLDSAGAYSWNRVSENQPAVVQRKSFDLWQLGFDAGWEADVFGGLRRGVEAAQDTVEAARADQYAVLVSLLGEVGQNYLDYRSLQQRIAIATDNIDAQRETLELTRRLFNVGLATELDVTRAEAQVATTESTIPLFEQQASQAMHRLGVLLGELPMALQTELAPIGAIPEGPTVVGIGLPSELLRRRPDVRRAERQLAASTANIGVATSLLYPRFFVLGTAGLESIDGGALFTWPSHFASIGPSITWPVFEGGRIRAGIALTTAQQEEQLAAYQNSVLQAFQEVEDALVAYDREQARSADLTRAVRANQRAAELARQLYAQGLTDFLSVLEAQLNLFITEDALAQSERAVAGDLVALYKALGGGWQGSAETPADEMEAAQTPANAWSTADLPQPPGAVEPTPGAAPK